MDNNSKLKLNIDLSSNINENKINHDKPFVINIPQDNHDIEITQLDNKIDNKIDNSGDPCLWLCFPCLFSITVCGTMCKLCGMTTCCIKPHSIDTISEN